MVQSERPSHKGQNAKYHSSISYGKTVMPNVKVFVTDRQTDGQTDRVITKGHPPIGGALNIDCVDIKYPAPYFATSKQFHCRADISVCS